MQELCHNRLYIGSNVRNYPAFASIFGVFIPVGGARPFFFARKGRNEKTANPHECKF